MADGAKLASGFIELTVKTGDAKKEIEALITGLDKDAEKAGQKAGDAINKSLSKGAKDAGKTLQTEVTKAAEQAGADAGDAIADGVTKAAEKAGADAGTAITKGVAKGTKDVGKSVGDEIAKATKKASDDAAKTKIEPKVAPKVDGKAAEKQAKDIGSAMDDVLAKAGTAAGRQLGTALTDAIGLDAGKIRDSVENAVGVDLGSVLGKALNKDAQGAITDVAGGLGAKLGSVLKDQISDAIGVDLGDVGDRVRDITGLYQSIKGRDPGSALTGVNTLTGGAVQPLSDLHDKLAESASGTNEFITELLGGTAAEKYIPKITSAAAPIAGSLALTAPVEDLLKKSPVGGGFFQKNLPDSDNFNWFKAPFRSAFGDIMHPSRFAKANQYDNNGNFIGDGPAAAPTASDTWLARVSGGPSTAAPYGGTTSAGEVSVSTQIATVSAGTVSLAGGISLPSSVTAGLAPRASAPAMPIVPKSAGSEGNSTASLYGAGSNSLLLGKYSGGGVAGLDKDGRLIGPGTGTSDSILGVDANGMPTALVSRGEGVVKDQAMRNGGGPVVAGLNAGLDPVSAAAVADPAGFAQRTQGYIPAAAGSSGQVGTSFASGLYQMGASAINGLIDQAAGVAAAGVGAMTFGTGGGAAGAAIGIGTQAAKRGVQYGAQMLGIGTDALAEILMPFGVPRWFNTDPTGFMPQWAIKPAAITTGEKAELSQTPEAQAEPHMQPGGPVQPGQLAGAQPVAAPAQMAKPEGVPLAPVPIGAPPGGAVPVPAPKPTLAPVPQPQGPQSGPMAGQQPKPDDDIYPNLANLVPFAKGGVVGVYDGGGILPAGGIAINQTKRPEPILNGQQWDTLSAIANAPVAEPDPAAYGSSGHDYSVHLGQVTVTDVNELMNEIDSRKRLQMMRHAGRP